MNGKNILHQLKTCSGSQMMSYVIETEDDKIIVIDGGYTADADYLEQYVRSLTGGEFRVDGWILTHAHSDHIDAFTELARRHPGCPFLAGKVYYNFPPAAYIDQYENCELHTLLEFNEVLPAFADRAQIVHTGDRFAVGAMQAEVLWEPDTSITSNVINNSSIVVRITLGKKVLLILGDLGVEGGKAVLAHYGDALKADLVEMAHHGQNGVDRDFYEAVKPSVCLWCAPQWLWDNNAGGGYNTHIWKTIIVRGWMEEMGVREHYVLKDGTTSISLD